MTIALAALACAVLPAVLVLCNLRLFRAPPLPAPGGARPCVSVLVPARDEERNIGAALAAILASRGVELEVVVLDDRSADRTAGIVAAMRRRDPRIRLLRGRPLPAGWCGKQCACDRLARSARHELLLFVDADVRLAPDAAARLVAFLEQSGAGLVSGFPRQVSGTLLERLLLPLIHWVLLGFLPLFAMRRTCAASFGVGCGQLMLARRDAYRQSGGHAAIRASRHDGLALPRAFRRAGFATDVCDASALARCRMYRSGRQTWEGLAKNAGEGLGAPARIVPFTALLLGGQLLAPLLAVYAAPALLLPALLLVFGPRAALARRWPERAYAVLLHPLAVGLLVAIQWHALWRAVRGRPARWRGRSYGRAGAEMRLGRLRAAPGRRDANARRVVASQPELRGSHRGALRPTRCE